MVKTKYPAASDAETARHASLLRAQGVRKVCGEARALTDANLKLGAGETLAITVPNASGKAPLLHAIASIITIGAAHVILHRPGDSGADDLTNSSPSEPVGALDSRTTHKMRDAVLASNASANRALVIVTRTERVAQRADEHEPPRDGQNEVGL